MGAPCGDGSEVVARFPCSGRSPMVPPPRRVPHLSLKRVGFAVQRRPGSSLNIGLASASGLRSGRSSLRYARGLSVTGTRQNEPTAALRLSRNSACTPARSPRRRGTKPMGAQRRATRRHNCDAPARNSHCGAASTSTVAGDALGTSRWARAVHAPAANPNFGRDQGLVEDGRERVGRGTGCGKRDEVGGLGRGKGADGLFHPQCAGRA